MDSENITMEEAIIEFYRDEIRKRYQLDRMRRFKEFDPIPDETLNALREFFLSRMYPPLKIRDEFQAAFDDLGHLLRSPTRLRPLLSAALMSMFWLGAHLPAALSAGMATVDALRDTTKLEVSMVEVAKRLKIGAKHVSDRRTMLRLLAELPQETVEDLIHDVVGLFRALSNVKMLSAMLGIMERSKDAMEARHETYSDTDRKSIAIALEALKGGHDLFLRVKPKDFPGLLKGIEIIEMEWYESVRKKPARKSPSKRTFADE